VFLADIHHGCAITAVLCRAEAKKLYASKPAFDELGIRLVTVVHQMPKLELEVSNESYDTRTLLQFQAR